MRARVGFCGDGFRNDAPIKGSETWPGPQLSILAALIIVSATLKKVLTLWDALHIMRLIHDCSVAARHTRTRDDLDQAAL